MSVFDAEISVMAAQVGTPNEDALKEGAVPHVELGITSGLMLPVPNPATGQPLVIPVGKLRFTFSREQAIEIFGGALKAAEALPATPGAAGNVMVASSMSDVARAAENMRRMTGQ